jgi:hypothetical protein
LVASLALRRASLVFFFGYVALLIVAGAWGIVGARADMRVLLRVHLGALPVRAQANLLSQYRFLRALELGFGLFALVFWQSIYRVRVYNRIFLVTMACGVAARLLGLVLDATPSWWMDIFLGWELVGVVLVFASTRASVAG